MAEAKKTAQNCAKRRTVEQDVRAAEESRPWRNFGVLCWTVYLRRLPDRPTSDGSRDPATTTPILYLPTVAGSFVGAITLRAFSHPEWGAPFFGVGVLSWLAIESVLVHRLYAASELLPPLRPTLGIQLAPPTVGCSAYLSITSGALDLFAQMLLGDGLFQALLLRGRLLPPPLLPPPESLHPTPRVI
ncbi:MAG TPA: hypothetical protein VNO35_06200 [Steroidobacteraceae bacterium]|nr:hypothetical protein [Steroidobacteraceae bacterium]